MINKLSNLSLVAAFPLSEHLCANQSAYLNMHCFTHLIIGCAVQYPKIGGLR